MTCKERRGLLNPVLRATPVRLETLFFYMLSLFAGLLVWQTAAWSVAGGARRFLFPTPQQVLQRGLTMVSDGSLLRHTGTTLLEMGLGFGVGTVAASVLGYAVARQRILAYLLEPLLVVSQAMPIVALAPLLTVWLGPGLASKVVVCALIVFFPILINVTAGLKGIQAQYYDLFRLLEASPRQRLLQLEIPAIIPAFLAGLRVGGTLAGMGAVVGEFVASSRGLGYLVKQGQNLYDMALMFVAIITLMVLTLVVYGILTGLERYLLRWQRHDPTR